MSKTVTGIAMAALVVVGVLLVIQNVLPGGLDRLKFRAAA